MAPVKTQKNGKPLMGMAVSKSTSKPRKPNASPSAAKNRKPKPQANAVKKKKKRVYTEKELGIPKLNMITPAGVQKVRGKKKGKIFVDDQESMMTILALVNSEKEGMIESKMIKSRQMEEIREARKKEAEARHDTKQSKLEDTKDSLRRGRRKTKGDVSTPAAAATAEPANSSRHKKRVSFG